MSGGFFRGTTADQDTRFSNKQAKLMKSHKFPAELEHLVDMTKVNMEVMKPWITKRVTELLGFEDEVLINFIHGLLDKKEVNGKEVQIQITGFMEKNTGKFMKELWTLLLTAQKNASGVPQQFLDAKEEELRKKKVENDRITSEVQKKKDMENKEIMEERLKKLDGGFDMKNNDGKESDKRNGVRTRNRVSRSPHSPPISTSPHRVSPSRSMSNSRSYSSGRHRSRSISRSPEVRGRSVSSERICSSPRRRSISPRRRSPWRSPNRRPYLQRRSRSRSNYRSPSPIRRRMHSPYRHSSPFRRRRTPSPIKRRRSPSPTRRHRSPSPTRRHRSPSPTRRHRSPSPSRRHRSPSPARRHRSPSPALRHRSPPARRHRSPSPARRRYRSPSPARRHRSPSPARRHRSPSPARRHRSPSPEHRHRSPSPARRRRSPSPARRRRSPSPLRRRRSPPAIRQRRSPSPVQRRSPVIRGRSPSPIQRRYVSSSPQSRSSSPFQRISPVSGQKRSTSPSPRRSLSPNELSSQSPTRRFSLSPVRRNSPRHQRNSPVRVQERLPPQIHHPSRPLQSRQQDKDHKSSHIKSQDSMSTPEKSPIRSISPQTRNRTSSEDRSDRTPVKGDESPAQKKSPINKDIHSSKKPRESYAVDIKKTDLKDRSHSNYAKNSDRGHKPEASQDLDGKVDRVNHDGSYDSVSEESDKHRKDRRTHKRSEKKIVSSDEDYSSDSELEDWKEAKRKKKENKKQRKEEKRQRREDRRCRRDRRRAEKLKVKGKAGCTSEDEDVERLDRSDNKVTLSEQTELEIELRNKALESLKAKRGVDN